MTIYTKTGDKGKTSLFDGIRVYKSDKKVETYASIDELNSSIGFAIAEISDKKLNKNLKSVTNQLIEIQHDLLEIGSSLAVGSTKPVTQLKKRPAEFEKQIDLLTLQMPVLTKFILPGGGRGGASLHVARTMARRAERRVVGLSKSEKIDETTIIYLNRLSDLLFTMARYVNYREKQKEQVWRKK